MMPGQAYVDPRITALASRLEVVEKGQHSMEERMDKMGNNMTKLEGKMNTQLQDVLSAIRSLAQQQADDPSKRRKESSS